MSEHEATPSSGNTRAEVLQRTVELLFSMVRQMHRGGPPHDPSLSPGQARLVFTIARHGGRGIPVTELARAADVTPGAVSQFADALIAKGVLSREEDQDDRRVVRLKLTPTARSRMNEIRHSFLASASSHFDGLTTGELKQLNALLAKVSLPAAAKSRDTI